MTIKMTNKPSRTSCPIIFKTCKDVIEIHTAHPGCANDVRKVTGPAAAQAVAAWLRANLGSLPPGTTLYVVTGDADMRLQ